MTLKEELDARVRNFRAKNPEPSIEEIDAKARSCAEREWKKLRKRFLSIQKGNEDVIIQVGVYGNSFVWKLGKSVTNPCHFRYFNRVRYREETMEWLRKMAENDGLKVTKNSEASYEGTTFIYLRYTIIYNSPRSS